MDMFTNFVGIFHNFTEDIVLFNEKYYCYLLYLCNSFDFNIKLFGIFAAYPILKVFTYVLLNYKISINYYYTTIIIIIILVSKP